MMNVRQFRISPRCRTGVIGVIGVLLMAPCLLAIEGDTGNPFADEQNIQTRDGLAETERRLRVMLADTPMDDEGRFHLGLVQFLRAIENLGQGLHHFGLNPTERSQFFVRLPVPENSDPAEIDYEGFLRLLEGFGSDLLQAEVTLSKIKDPDVKLGMRLAEIGFQFDLSTDERVGIQDVLRIVSGRDMPFPESNPEMLIKFDRGDVAWLRSYCHALSGIVDIYGAYDSSNWFNTFGKRFFPRVRETELSGEANVMTEVLLRDPVKLHSLKMHLIAVCELNAETWRHIRAETDDDHEWLPNAKQTDQLGLPITDEQIDSWLAAMAHLKGVFRGERLIPSGLLGYAVPGSKEGLGFSVAKFMDDPPINLNWERISTQGIDPKYLEKESGREALDVLVMLRVAGAFNGPFGLLGVIRMN